MEKFINNFADLFDETNTSEFNSETNFKNLEEWDSLIALSVMSMIDEVYEVSITADEIRTANTINDLFLLILSKK